MYEPDEVQVETPPAPAPPAPEPQPEPSQDQDQVVQTGEIALPSEGKVRLVTHQPYEDEPTKDRMDRVEKA